MLTPPVLDLAARATRGGFLVGAAGCAGHDSVEGPIFD